ncbi:MAG TPA: HAMP domain-containing protein [Burkholderiales bacterium]|nr:HAMP domain-containing protein [Burkholderiales bacterium]
MFRYLSHRIMAVVGVAVTLGLALTAFVYTREQERVLHRQHARNLERLADTAIQSLQSVMLAGYADAARSYADRLKRVPGIADFRILRTDGSEAFLDNDTIHAVNRQRGQTLFRARDGETRVEVLAPGNALLEQALRSGRGVSLQETDPAGMRLVTFLVPIPSEERCHACHGNGNGARGVVKLTASLATVEGDIRIARQQSLIMAAMALVITLLLTGVLISRTVSRPVRHVTDAMTRAAAGDLSLRVPSSGKDEIARMAESFNRMGAQLASTYEGLKREQDKLTTIISSADEGIVVTDGRGGVVLVNRAAEALLGKRAGTVM